MSCDLRHVSNMDSLSLTRSRLVPCVELLFVLAVVVVVVGGGGDLDRGRKRLWSRSMLVPCVEMQCTRAVVVLFVGGGGDVDRVWNGSQRRRWKLFVLSGGCQVVVPVASHIWCSVSNAPLFVNSHLDGLHSK